MQRSWEIGRALVLVGLTGLPMQFALAADETPNADSDSLAEVVVTATHRAENQKDVPVSISVVDSNLIQSLGNSGQDIKQLAFESRASTSSPPTAGHFPACISVVTVTPTSTTSPLNRSGCTTTTLCRKIRP